MAVVFYDGKEYNQFLFNLSMDLNTRVNEEHRRRDGGRRPFATTINEIIRDYFMLMDLKEEFARQQ